MISPSSYRDEPFSWLPSERQQTEEEEERRRREGRGRAETAAEMAENSEENVPLLAGSLSNEPQPMYGDISMSSGDRSVVVNEEDPEDPNDLIARHPSGSTVNCRVCDAVIELEGRSAQHVVKCAHCMEATPIRPAPPGKKYVRCPCNCLLICKAASTRIACPRQNCRRVITLGQSAMTGTAMPAPTGTCRVSCAHCAEVFMFNTLTNMLATCPHCRQRSSVGSSFRRSRLLVYSLGCLAAFIAAIVGTALGFEKNIGWILWGAVILLYALSGYLGTKALNYFTTKVSTVVAPM